jgi:hypothetical protein
MEVRAGRKKFSFWLVGTAPYTKRDGTETTVKLWRALCRECRQPFEVTTPAGVVKAKQSHAFNIRRCSFCRAGEKIAA